MKKEKCKITINTGRNLFYYSGIIIEEKDDYILFLDDKNGELRLYKHSIISIQEIDGTIKKEDYR